MGRSFSRVRAEGSEQAEYFHAASERRYLVNRREGKLIFRRGQTGFDGGETNVVEREAHYILGSGNHSKAFLHRKPDGRLVELPLGWYAEDGGHWAMNPGFDRPDHDDFRREISFQCMFCHNGYPSIAPGADAFGTAPVFPATLPEGIDCQRCHGPGQAHVEAMRAGRAANGTIVNPARLSNERQMDLCMQCHLETTSFRLPGAIVRYSRGVFSYRPGEPLGDYVLHFDRPEGSERFEIAHAAYRLRKSACFIKSEGKMVCTTCHNPHERPNAEAARGACLQCHSKKAPGHTESQDCQGCHMPRRRTDDAVHVVMTDHFIQRRKPAIDLLESKAEVRETDENSYRGPVSLYYPRGIDEPLYLAVAQVRQGANLKEGIPKLERLIAELRPREAEFYFELAEAHRKTGAMERAVKYYEQASAIAPGSVPAIRGLAAALGRLGQLARAREVLKKAADGGPADAGVWNDLGLIQVGLGATRDAVASLEMASALNPDFAEAYNNLGGVWLSLGDRVRAEAAYREALRAVPDLAEARRNLANLLAESNFKEAEFHWQKAATARADFDYGMALAKREAFNKALAQFQRAVQRDPKFAEAHNAAGEMFTISGNAAGALAAFRKAAGAQPEFAPAQMNLGVALAMSRRLAEAKPHLEKAVALQPDAWEAHFHLAQALLAEGNRGKARDHFRFAAGSPEAELRDAARAALSRLP